MEMAWILALLVLTNFSFKPGNSFPGYQVRNSCKSSLDRSDADAISTPVTLQISPVLRSLDRDRLHVCLPVTFGPAKPVHLFAIAQG